MTMIPRAAARARISAQCFASAVTLRFKRSSTSTVMRFAFSSATQVALPAAQCVARDLSRFMMPETYFPRPWRSNKSNRAEFAASQPRNTSDCARYRRARALSS